MKLYILQTNSTKSIYSRIIPFKEILPCRFPLQVRADGLHRAAARGDAEVQLDDRGFPWPWGYPNPWFLLGKNLYKSQSKMDDD